MRKRLAIIGTVSFVLLAGLFYYLYLNRGHDWRLTYDHHSEEPYGTQFIKTLLADLHKDQALTVTDKPLKHAIKDRSDSFNYVRIHQHARFDQASIKQLVQHVFEGNQAFIATSAIPKRLLGRVLDPGNKEYYYEWQWRESDSTQYPIADFSHYDDTGVQMRILQPLLNDSLDVNFYHQKRYAKSKLHWPYLDSLKDITAKNRITYLGSINKTHPNFLKVQFGEGSFFFHFSPIALTNYHINRKKGFTYAQEVFAVLDKKPLLFDAFEPRPESKPPDKERFGESPLQFILRQKSLRWAWYWGLLTVLFYLLFRAKRRQQIIPVRPGYKNETMAFVKSIGRIHQQQQDVKGVSAKLMGIFQSYLRDHYKLNTRTDEEQLAINTGRLAGLDPQLVRNIFTKYHEIQRSSNQEETEADLRNFYAMIHNFFKKSK